MLGRHRKASGGTLERNSGIDAIRETERLGKLQLGTICRGGGMADAADLKSSFRLLTWCYQAILSSIYRRFGRQSKLTSC